MRINSCLSHVEFLEVEKRSLRSFSYKPKTMTSINHLARSIKHYFDNLGRAI